MRLWIFAPLHFVRNRANEVACQRSRSTFAGQLDERGTLEASLRRCWPLNPPDFAVKDAQQVAPVGVIDACRGLGLYLDVESRLLSAWCPESCKSQMAKRRLASS